VLLAAITRLELPIVTHQLQLPELVKLPLRHNPVNAWLKGDIQTASFRWARKLKISKSACSAGGETVMPLARRPMPKQRAGNSNCGTQIVAMPMMWGFAHVALATQC
jgi:hypothetical protein